MSIPFQRESIELESQDMKMQGRQKNRTEPLHIEEVLEKQGFYMSTTVGTSMYPLLRNRRDTIVIYPVTEPLKKYDVPLYRRREKYVLHRIVKVTPQGYVICGDNCIQKEYDITQDQIIGVLRGIRRGEREIKMDGISYQCYCRLWVAFYPVRCVVKRVIRKLKNGIKKVTGYGI